MSARVYRRQLADGTAVDVHHEAKPDGGGRLTAVVRLRDTILKRLTVPTPSQADSEALSEQARDLAIDALRATGR